MLTKEQEAELGASVAEIMGEFARFANKPIEGFEVSDASISFYLGDSAGELVGNWKVIVVREGLD